MTTPAHHALHLTGSQEAGTNFRRVAPGRRTRTVRRRNEFAPAPLSQANASAEVTELRLHAVGLFCYTTAGSSSFRRPRAMPPCLRPAVLLILFALASGCGFSQNPSYFPYLLPTGD